MTVRYFIDFNEDGIISKHELYASALTFGGHAETIVKVLPISAKKFALEIMKFNTVPREDVDGKIFDAAIFKDYDI